jgi:hypothetical protein
MRGHHKSTFSICAVDRDAGEVGCADPVAAAQDAIRAVAVDEVILSTLPSGVSRWLGQDVPARLRRAVSVPVTVVTAQNGS